MAHKNKQKGLNPFHGLGRHDLDPAIIRISFLLIIMTGFLALQTPAQTNPKFYKWSELKFPTYSRGNDAFQGYGMQIILKKEMHIKEYEQNPGKGKLGHVWIRASDEILRSEGLLYNLIIERWSYEGICGDMNGILADQLDILKTEFDLKETGYITSKNLYVYHQMYQYQPYSSYLSFSCKKLEGKPGNIYRYGEVCVGCIGVDLIMVYLLDQEKEPRYTLWYFPIEFAKFQGFK